MKFLFYRSRNQFKLDLLNHPLAGSFGMVGNFVDPEPPLDSVGGGGSGTPPPEPEDVSGLKSALQKERTRASDFERRIKQMESLYKDVDPERYKQFEALQQEAEKWNQKEAELKQTLETEYTRQIKLERDAKVEAETKFLGLLKRTLIEKAYQAAGGRSGGAEDGVTFFDSFYANVGDRLKLGENGNTIEVIDEKGVKLFSRKDSTKPMNPVEFFQEMLKHPVYGHFFMPQQPGKGGGMQPNTPISMSQDFSNLPRAERLTLLRQQGQH